MRHSCADDRVIFRKEYPDLDPVALERPLLQAEDKLGALRLDVDLVEAFSSGQDGDRLATGGKRADLLLAFAAAGPDRAEFLGAWTVKGVMPRAAWVERYGRYLFDPPPVMKGYCKPGRRFLAPLGLSPSPCDASVHYDLEPRPDVLAGLAGRLIVEWDNPIQWIQPSLDRAILEVRAAGFVKPFTEFLEVSLSWDELVAIVEHHEGNPEWRGQLSAVSGIYLITDKLTGSLYVGSACGTDGIWGRWTGYAQRDAWHNGNLGLRNLFEKDRGYARNFRFTLLYVMGPSTPKAQVIECESLWKERLGSRAVGLGYNLN